jgi:four helix bundle protein
MSNPSSPPEQLAWERVCSPHIVSDIAWQLDAYRAALYLQHCVHGDLVVAKAMDGVRDQLTRAAGAVAADLAEGYSRSTRADRLRFYGYALGSIRECSVWYLGLRGTLDDGVLNDRLALIARCRALLLGMLRSQRTTGVPRERFRP